MEWSLIGTSCVVADSGFADTIRRLGEQTQAALTLRPAFARVYQDSAEYAPAGTAHWVARVSKLLGEIVPALAGLEAERDELKQRYDRRTETLMDDASALAAVLETTREALTTLWRAERGARMQALLGNDGDAAAIRGEAIRSALGLKFGEAMPHEPPPRLSALSAEDANPCPGC